MGRRIIALATADAELRVIAAMEAAGSSAIGSDAGELAGVGRIGVPVADRCSAEFDVLIDFSLPQGTAQWLNVCRETRRPIVIGTTGHSEAQLRQIRDAASEIAVLKAANMSVGVNVLLRVARQLGAVLDAGYDVEITEAHHRFKVDAPSGTALALAEAIRQGRRAAGLKDQPLAFGRQGQTGQRPAGEIGVHSLRIGDTVGEHCVAFGTLGEVITIAHSAHSRDTFAAGGLRAAKWIVGRPPGLYDMEQVLFGTADAGAAPDE
jgi:4-hydroxy-tetrahydrodipicolinate reductase